jgi:type I restriction enzyme, S subunit
MLLLRVNPEKVDARFLVKQFNAGFFQKQIDAIKSARATKQTELGVDNLLNLLFVIPPLPVQVEIIERIEVMKAEIIEAKSRTEELRRGAKEEFEAELFGIS